MTIPARYAAPCAFCHEPVDTRPGRGSYREERGWAPIRTAGGTSSLALREASGRFACKACVEVAKSKAKARFWDEPELALEWPGDA